MAFVFGACVALYYTPMHPFYKHTLRKMLHRGYFGDCSNVEIMVEFSKPVFVFNQQKTM